MDGFLTDNGIHLKMEHSFHLSVMRHTHAHPQYELYFCPHKVTQTSVINGVEYTYKYPCAILSAPFTVHSMSCADTDALQYERYVFYFSEKLPASFSSHFPLPLSERNSGLLFALTEAQGAYLKKLLDLCDSADSLAQRELTFVLFMNKLLDFCPKENVIQVGSASFYIRRVLQYISENFSSPVSAEQLAQNFAVSRSKLDRDFKKFTGVTVYRFVDICRLNHAKYLLWHQKELSVREVALRCGFDSDTNFFPFFKKQTGQTPLQFRRTPSAIVKNDILFDLDCGCRDDAVIK